MKFTHIDSMEKYMHKNETYLAEYRSYKIYIYALKHVLGWEYVDIRAYNEVRLAPTYHVKIGGLPDTSWLLDIIYRFFTKKSHKEYVLHQGLSIMKQKIDRGFRCNHPVQEQKMVISEDLIKSVFSEGESV